jgi:hypothetical protein
MKYPWLVAIAILPSVGAADSAGQWCGDVTDYVFTPDTLTVKFHDRRPANVFKITKYTYTNNSVRIDWLNDAGKESVTVFAEFVGNSTTMAQQQNGDKPRRPPPLLRLSMVRAELFLFSVVFRVVRAMSASHPKADIGERNWNVRFVPKADLTPLRSFDQDARNAGCSDPSSNENRTGIISFVATLPFRSFWARTSC